MAVSANADFADFYFHEGNSFRTERIPLENFAVSDTIPEEGKYELLAGTLPLKYRILRPEKTNSAQYAFSFSTQALIRSGVRLFAGMEFGQIRRFQIHIEGDAKHLDLLRCCDTQGWSAAFSGSEEEMLAGLFSAIEKRDPDVLEGYDFFRSGWESLSAAAKRCKFQMLPGRGGFPVTQGRTCTVIGERKLYHPKLECPGRHIVDLLHLVLLHDVIKRDMSGFDLQEAADYFSLKSELPEEQMRELGTLLEPSFFYLTQLLPLTYQETILRGNGSKIEALFAGEYLKHNHSLPRPDAPLYFTGALSKVERSGIFRPVWHCDVRSLYPSILLAENWAPAKDELRLFPALLKELRTFRLEAKDKAKTAQGGEKAHYSALQSAFKIVINSFYGYLGFAQGSFNDYALAAKVTARGREILGILTEFLSSSGAEVIEMDTDGVYFRPPAGAETGSFEKGIQGALPPGITIELDAVYPAMYSHKAKNYALLAEDGEIELTGAALKSRGMEPFFRKFLKEILRKKLTGKESELPALLAEMKEQISSHAVPLKELCKSETLSDSTANYKKKLEAGTGRKSAAYEVLLKAGRIGRSGDKVEFYLTGSKVKPAVAECAQLPGAERDENVPYYLARAEELFETFGKQE